MRYIHPAAWGGLVLNALFILAGYASLSSLSPSEIPGLDPKHFADFQAVLKALRPVLLLLLLAQILGLVLIALRFTLGLVIAVLTSLFTMPFGLVYLVGCFYSHYRWKYACFAVSREYGGAVSVFRSASAAAMPYFAFGACALGVLALAFGLADIGVVLLGIGAVNLHFARRVKRLHPLSIHRDHITLMPGLFVGPLLVPYSSIRSATLYDDESIRFEIETNQGPFLLTWSLRRVEAAQRRAALESLGEALEAHGVPLY